MTERTPARADFHPHDGARFALLGLASRLRSTAAALVAHGANRADLAAKLDDLERDLPGLLAAVRGEVQP